MAGLPRVEREIMEGMLVRRPDLEPCVEGLAALHGALVASYDQGGKLAACGNGGSAADAMHIAGELCKSVERKRPVPREVLARLKGLLFGDALAVHLEAGLPAITLGLNASLKSAVENDASMANIAFAQEALALLRPGDVLLAISTSGNAQNCLLAMSAAKAVGAVAVTLTGPAGGVMADAADIAVRAPGESTKVVQEAHVVLYHTMCALIEAHYFPEPR